ncbi:DMT family transporter [Candidatus Dependentiae bacterium]|nr:DMT family transporter [Candidatus Dependentiae bacterium]
MIQVFIAFALIASGITANKFILYSWPPIFLVGLRSFIAGIILILLNVFRSERLRFSYLKTDLKILLFIAFFTTLIPSILKAFALKYMISSKATLLGSIDPFITALYVYLLWNEKISLQKIIGITVAFSGIFLLLITSTPIEESLKAFWIFSYPELAAIIAVAINRYGWMLGQNLLKQSRYMPLELNGITMLISGFFSLILSFWLETVNYSNTVPDIKFMALIWYTIIFGNILGYGFYSNALKKFSSTFVSIAGFSVPILVYIYGLIFLHEKWSNIFLLSFAITLLGLFIFYQQEFKKIKKI